MKRLGSWIGGALLAAMLLVGVDAYGQYTTVGRRLRVFIAGTEQYGVAALNLPSGSSCDGGTCTVAGGGGGGSALPSGATDNSIVRADGNDGGIQSSQATVEDNGSIGMVASATVDGVDVSQLAADFAAYPANPLPSTAVRGLDGGYVRGVSRCEGSTTIGDGGMLVSPSCRFLAPLNKVSRYRVLYIATSVAGFDAATQPANGSTFCRIYSIRTSATGIAATNTAPCEADWVAITGSNVALGTDGGGVVETQVQGVAATNIRWTIEIEDFAYGENP